MQVIAVELNDLIWPNGGFPLLPYIHLKSFYFLLHCRALSWFKTIINVELVVCKKWILQRELGKSS